MSTATTGQTAPGNAFEVSHQAPKEHAPGATQQEVSSTAKSNPFVCDICKNRYSRIDHLARHFRKHTEQKSISCPRCPKSFSRPDTLKRHMNIHKFIGSSSGGAVTGKHRQRAAKACFSCAESKLRCEGDKPCRRCKERGLPCRFPQKSRPEPSTHWKTSSSTDKLQPTTASSSSSTNREPSPVSTTFEDCIENDSHAIPALVDTVDTVNPAESQAASVQTSQELPDSPSSEPITPKSFEKGPAIDQQNSILSSNTIELQQPSSIGFFAEPGCLDLPDAPGYELGWSWDTLNLDLLDFGALETQALSAAPPNTDDVPGADRGFSLGAKAYKQSFLHWMPMEGEDWLTKTADLSPALEEMICAYVSSDSQQHNIVHLQSSTRYRILSSILSIANSADHHRILSSFPSLEVLEYLLSMELSEHSREADPWLHVPSFDPNTACTELIIGLIIAGAFRSDCAVFLKFALALHEVHRQLIARLFCGDLRNVRLLDPFQCFVLMIQAGLWSGDSRRIEISESFISMPITMMRRGGFLRLPYPEGISPHPCDNEIGLKDKWHAWVDYESRKRLGLHLLILSTQYSMAFLNPPPMTHAEMHTTLPGAPALWNAPSAEAWRTAWLSLDPPTQLTLHACIEELNSLSGLGNSVDIRYTTLAVLSGLWLNTWQYKERLKAREVTRGATRTMHALSIQALYQEARESLESFATIHVQWLGPMDPSLVVLHERQLMYLHVSLEELQLLGGKDGEPEARRVLPRLKEWAESRSCRQAMWHAGQILREARRNGDPTLRVSTIIAIYHASLILWSYSIMLRVRLPNGATEFDLQPNHRCLEGPDMEIVLDGDHTPQVQQFCVLGFGKPCITHECGGTNGVQHLTIEVIHQPEVMAVFRDVLCERYISGYQDCPSLVDNLIRLIGQLGQAAQVIQHWQSEGA